MLLVNGGPGNSGRKLPLKPSRMAWFCACGRFNRGYVVRCLRPGCNERRP